VTGRLTMAALTAYFLAQVGQYVDGIFAAAAAALR